MRSDPRYDEFTGPVNDDPRNVAVIATDVLMLDSVEAAEAAYRFHVQEHESADGWGLAPLPTLLARLAIGGAARDTSRFRAPCPTAGEAG